ncbi:MULTISPECIES: GlxA family transcriptional regulator [Microvirgula]|uniref:GlxA family transcriptional regulator n=1 Tax=Microvirgula TaxID=57479 RepID=UPI000A04E7B2|nr:MULTISPECIES: helix-turn-helix domain-containing protein [Microvirgula]
MIREIGFFIYPGHQMLDLAGPLCAFEIANHLHTSDTYRFHLLSTGGGAVLNSLGLPQATVPSAAIQPQRLDTLIVVGAPSPFSPADLDTEVFRSLVTASRRVASVCTGVFLLAALGVLDRRKVTTHWRYVDRLRQDYPSVRVDGEQVFVQDGDIWTSAGITAGIDLAIALIEVDHGIDLARAVAREMVVYHRRAGGQSQFSTLGDLAPASDRIRNVLAYVRENVMRPIRVDDMARVACISSRQFARVFKRETGESPARAIERIRVEIARDRIESGSESLEKIAGLSGFVDPERMRRAFIRIIGRPPCAIRQAGRN